MIAVRVRATGHSQEQIETMLKQCASKQRPHENRNWNKYAAATAQRVFGERGYRDDLMRLEGRDPKEIGGHEITRGRDRHPRKQRTLERNSQGR